MFVSMLGSIPFVRRDSLLNMIPIHFVVSAVSNRTNCRPRRGDVRLQTAPTGDCRGALGQDGMV